jgi:hypothetical protein
MLSIVAFYALSAQACTGHTELKLVGHDDKGTKAVVRVESVDDDEGAPGIELVVLDLANGATELERLEVLAPEDKGDAKVRGANWAAAEARLEELQIRVDPAITSLPLEGSMLPKPVSTPSGAELAFSFAAQGEGEDTQKLLLVGSAAKGERIQHWDVLTEWPWYINVNAHHFVKGVYALPGGPRVLVVEGPACVEPSVHVVGLR